MNIVVQDKGIYLDIYVYGHFIARLEKHTTTHFTIITKNDNITDEFLKQSYIFYMANKLTIENS